MPQCASVPIARWLGFSPCCRSSLIFFVLGVKSILGHWCGYYSIGDIPRTRKVYFSERFAFE